MIVFGDITMHEDTPREQVKRILGDDSPGFGSHKAIEAWRKVTQKWNTWFMRRPTGKKGDAVDKQWARAIGEQKIFHIQDEQRAVDYAMGLIARAWGNFDDFQSNMLARQSPEKVGEISKPLALICPRCGAPIPKDAFGMFKCGYCNSTLKF
jgi:ribosomal protein L40E